MSTQARARQLQDWIGQGKILDAMSEFYAPEAAMQENTSPPTVGLAANIEREKQFLAQVRDWKGYQVKSLAVDGDVALVESAMDFVDTQGRDVHTEQVSVQRWKNGKIVHERFYYNAAG